MSARSDADKLLSSVVQPSGALLMMPDSSFARLNLVVVSDCSLPLLGDVFWAATGAATATEDLPLQPSQKWTRHSTFFRHFPLSRLMSSSFSRIASLQVLHDIVH